MAQISVPVCDRCRVILHPANWWLDAEICNDCGLYVPMEQPQPEQQPEPPAKSRKYRDR